ncbi:MAG: 50S ribosomal protein L15 [Acidobacteria bacterium 13_1_40CM_2_68_5]|nr:MAG: 50S ribosomal protein L15 [Acidobacteria bacterium 13_1_40CM_2_68_5]
MIVPRSLDLSSLKPAKGSRKKPKRIGRGPGSGHGKTATAGNKGQLSRSGRKQYFGFEGGQMPLQRRVPKRGVTNLFRKEYAVVNLGALNALEGEITPERLVKEGLVKKLLSGVKVLGDGELTRPIVVKAHRFSKSAVEKITRAGGRAETITATSEA